MRYEYVSKYTQRPLHSESWQPPRKVELSAAQKARHRKLEEERRSWATQRKRANDAIRCYKRELRLQFGFDSRAEAEAPPFRPFEALDNLGKPGEALLQLKEGPFSALPRLQRELNRERARVKQSASTIRVSDNTASKLCSPKLSLNLRQLKRPRTVHNLDIEKIESDLKQHFFCLALQKDEPQASSKTPPIVTKSLKTKGAVKINTEFSGIFPTQEPESTDKCKKEESSPPQILEVRKEGYMLDTREQKKFVTCARQGLLSEMKALFRNHHSLGNVEVNSLCDNGDNALHAAAATSQIEVLEYLILMNVDQSVMNIDNLLPREILHLSPLAERTHKHHSRFRRARAMLASDVPFFTAAKVGDLERLQWLCDIGKANMQDRNKYGMTALHYAAMYGHRRLIKGLVELGMDIEITNNVGQTPLDLLPRKLIPKCAKWLTPKIDDLNEKSLGTLLDQPTLESPSKIL